MKSAQHRLAAHLMAVRKAVSVLRLGRRGVKRRRDTRSKAHVNTAMIGMVYPPIEDFRQMPLPKRYEEIQAIPADRSD